MNKKMIKHKNFYYLSANMSTPKNNSECLKGLLELERTAPNEEMKTEVHRLIVTCMTSMLNENEATKMENVIWTYWKARNGSGVKEAKEAGLTIEDIKQHVLAIFAEHMKEIGDGL